MKLRVIDWLKCPICQSEFTLQDAHAAIAKPSEEASPPSECEVCRVAQSEPHRRVGVGERDCIACYHIEVDHGQLACQQGHVFPIIHGVPSFTASFHEERHEAISESASTGSTIHASFSTEWSHFDYNDRTWARDIDDRAELFLKEIGCSAEELGGKTVLDAGCGNGSLSRAVNRFGCEVLAADISDSVDKAYRYFAARGNDRTHFIKANLAQHPFSNATFDIIYSSGVLHHNPNTRAALVSLIKALKPGGKIYIWVYHKIPGVKHGLKQMLRSCLAPLPNPLKHTFVRLWLPQAMLRQYLRTILGIKGPQDHLRWRERLILLLDHYTPRYRWEHTQEEVHTWYGDLGLVDIMTTEVREWGFGVVGRKPVELCAARG